MMPASTEVEISSFYRSIPILTEVRSVRVLDVQSAPSANDDGPIKGTLRSVELDKKPNYFALSYVCGTPATGNHLVACGETLIAVTENCYLALKHLYLKLGHFTIWVDAVCIHQQDVVEKARQIAVMGDIFAHASIVYVWLGVGTAQREIAMRYLNNVQFLDFFTVNGETDGTEYEHPKYWRATWSAYSSRWSVGWLSWRTDVGENLGWLWLCSPEEALKGKIDSFNCVFAAITDDRHSEDTSWHYVCLPKLLSTEWIERIWTYQEILSAQNAIVVCGSTHISWSRLAYSIIAEDLIPFTWNEKLPSWRKLIFTKAQFDAAQDQSKTVFVDELTRYQAFVCAIADLYRYVRYLLIVLANLVGMSCWVTGLLYATLSSPGLGVPLIIIGILLGGAIAFLLVYLPGRHGIRYRMINSSKEVLLSKASSSEGLIDALSTRKASSDLDMAFGVQYILEKLLHRSLPVPDLNAIKPTIYRELTSMYTAQQVVWTPCSKQQYSALKMNPHGWQIGRRVTLTRRYGLISTCTPRD